MRYESFVIRLWSVESDERDADSRLRGRIEHVQSGAVVHVADLEGILRFIKRQFPAVAPDADEHRGDHPVS